MSDTPRTDALANIPTPEYKDVWVWRINQYKNHSREIERELTKANELIEDLQDACRQKQEGLDANKSLAGDLLRTNEQLEIYKQSICISKIDETEAELKEKTVAYERLLRSCMHADELGELNEFISGWTLNEALRVFNKYKPEKLKSRKG